MTLDKLFILWETTYKIGISIPMSQIEHTKGANRADVINIKLFVYI